MRKTKDAFGLRGFDAQRILGRKFFSLKFNLLADADTWQTDSDAENLDSLFNVAAVNHLGTAKMKERLSKAQALKAATATYTQHLFKHELKLERFEQDAKYHDRAILLRQRYRAVIESLGTLQKKINQLVSDGEKAIPKIFCRELGERIRTARESTGLKRQDVASTLGFSQNALAQYERGERELSPYTLVRLSEILGRSLNWLLGLTP